MTKKEIKKQIVESLLENKSLISSLMDQIKNDSELNEYYEEMKALLDHQDDDTYDPGDEYFEASWRRIESKLDQHAQIIPLYRQSWIQIAAAFIIIFMSYYVGTLQNSPKEPNPIVVSESQQKLNTLFHKYNVTLTSFVNMDEYESYDLLKTIIKSSEALLDDTRNLKREYKSKPDIYELLSGFERILIGLTHLKDKSAKNVRVMQYKLQNEVGSKPQI